MDFDDLPLEEKLPRRFLDQLKWPEDRPGRVLVQNFADGRIKLARDEIAASMCGPVAADRDANGQRMYRPPTWRRVRSEEAEQLWTVQTYFDYYFQVGQNGQSDYEKAVRALRKHKEILNEDPKLLPQDQRDYYKRARAEADKLEAGKRNMREYARRQVDRDIKTGKWRIGRLEEGKAKVLQDWLRGVALEAKKNRDAAWERQQNDAVYRKAAIEAKARRQAESQVAAVADAVEEEIAVAVEEKPKKKRGRPRKNPDA